jgi:cyclic beta-1,2-glucan synthetase
MGDRNGAGLLCFNGIGGFNADGEYEMRLDGEHLPPTPWTNVIANPSAGFMASESGFGVAWAVNSSFFRLTPWQNDPVCDEPGECIYIRDENSRELWTATPAPIREKTRYVTKHGAGYTVYEHEHDGIVTSLRAGMAESDPVKIQILSITNSSSGERRLAITSYVDWLLGTDRERVQGHVMNEMLTSESTMLAANTFDHDYADQVAFTAVSEELADFTADRRSFLGMNGSLSAPVGGRQDLNGCESSGDPCCAMQMRFSFAPGETREIVIVLGSVAGKDNALALASRYRQLNEARAELDRSKNAWQARLSTIKVTTADPTFDLIINQWALYQALSCRMWGRIALYQSSGAYGFRDQLQDSMAFVYAEPKIARDHIVFAASRQFEEGDVQHWWHPDSGRGVRTHFADDLIWLTFVINHYLRVTGDISVLDEVTPYLRLRILDDDEDEIYDVPDVSQRTDSVYTHCVRALRRACTAGAHGLPLIRGGDWNDGMNRVGVGGKGESVWLAWFLYLTLHEFAPYAKARGDNETAAWLTSTADAYAAAVESTSWDGEWYRRAYYDDGAPLGSHVNTECAIDSIAQSWSVISQAGDPERAMQAMRSFEKHLVREDARLLMLLTPSFNEGSHDPGYIRGYLPGVRENGAQYTHAAIWSVLATAMLGHGDRAFELFQMINPITHALTPEAVATYKVEPYVVAADVYTAEGHLGRGGWTWYTGSASWLYRVGLEAILGFKKLGDTLVIDPCIPSSWDGFRIEYRFGSTIYAIHVKNPSHVERGVTSTTVDGIEGPIRLVDDGRRREINVILGSPQ